MNDIYSEISTFDGKKAWKIEILKMKKGKIFTTSPKAGKQIVLFIPNERVKITHFENGSFYQFEAIFKKIQMNNGEMVFIFVITESKKHDNHRKIPRKSVNHQAIIANGEEFGLAKVLDISEKGMKIETTKPLKNKLIEVYYDKENREVGISGIIVWKKRESGNFQYGVELL